MNVCDEESSLVKLLGQLGTKRSEPKTVTFGSNLNDIELTDEILETLETGDNIVDDKIDYTLQEVQSLLQEMEMKSMSLHLEI